MICQELLGVAIDPARVSLETARLITEFVDEVAGSVDDGKGELICDLVLARTRLADGTDSTLSESATDDILTQLHRMADLG